MKRKFVISRHLSGTNPDWKLIVAKLIIHACCIHAACCMLHAAACRMIPKSVLYLSACFCTFARKRSVTAESAKKADSPFAGIVTNLQSILKKASDDGIVFTGELQSRASERLAQAGVSV